ncbi:MAG: T9SS type A sorting domain-containing protein [Bacteroidota bacterium]|nr:T9SS type A sorting domain-containing protein [Bacteroidota bacterium]
MSTEQYLNKLFETARHAEPLLSSEDIELQLKVKGIHTPKRFNLFNLKTVLIMSILIVFFSSLFFWLPLHKTEQVFEPVKQIEKLTDKKIIADPILAAVNVKKATNFVAAKPDANNSFTNPFASSDPQLFPTQFSIAFTEPKVDQEGEKPYLILTNEELRGLHIYTDGNVLMYINTKDSTLFERKKLSTVPHYFYLKMTYEGGSVTYTSASLDTSIKDQRLLEVQPSMVERIITYVSEKKEKYHKVGENVIYFCDNNANRCVREHYISEAKTFLIPIKISLIGRESIYGRTDHDLIFWFKPTEEFLKALPIDKRDWVTRYYGKFDAAIYETTIARLIQERKQINKSIDIDSIQAKQILQRTLVCTNKELKNLGFSSKGKSMHYANKYDEKKYLKMDLRNEYYISVAYLDHVPFYERRKYTSLSFSPMFATDLKIQSIEMFIKEINLPEDIRGFNHYDQAKHYFYRMREKLIPVQIHLPKAKPNPITKIFWFEPTPEFLAALPKDKLPLVKAEPKLPEVVDRSIDLRNIKVIELTPAELKKFGITVSDKAVHLLSGGHAIPGVKLKPFYSNYNKEGSSFTFNLKPDDNSSIKNQFKIKLASDSFNTIDYSDFNDAPDSTFELPHYSLITDDLGQKWRMYEVDDGLTKEDWEYMRKNQLNPLTWEKSANGMKEGERKLIANLGGYIPILVRSGDINNKDDDKNNLWRADIIIWYEPTELLFKTLPPRIANELRAEYQSIFVQKESNGANCKFFEACKNKPGAIESYNIFPNPTDDDLQIEFTLSDARLISANLYTVNGQLVKSILNQKVFESGSNKHATRINDLAPGIYLLVIESDKGDIISQRIVRK